jgi:two-component system OmpR family response regulator
MGSPGERRIAVIIEDDADIRHLLETVLGQAGFETVSTSNGTDGVEAVRTHCPIVTTLDVSMPGIDGFEVAKRIREFSSTYIVMLTARDEEIDLLQGLDSGADDYVTKPFRPRELRARIEAMLRRPRVQADSAPAAAAVAMARSASAAAVVGSAQMAESSPIALMPVTDVDEETVLRHNNVCLNTDTRVVTLDGSEIDLTRSEFELLAGLLESGRRVRSKHDLALLLRGDPYVTSSFVSETDKRAVEVHMTNLRRKLRDNALAPRYIETVRGVGYRLSAHSA